MSVFYLSQVEHWRTCNKSIGTISKEGRNSRLIVYDHAMGKVVFDVEPEIPSMCATLAYDGQSMAIGYWDRANIDLWNLSTRCTTTVRSPSQVYRVLFDATGNWLVYQSERGTYAVDIARDVQTRILHVGDLHTATARPRDNALIVPWRRKGQVGVIRFDPVVVETKLLQIGTVIRCLRQSPVDQCQFIIDGKGSVYCFDDDLDDVAWKTAVTERPFIGEYSGDGSLIGVLATEFSGPSWTIVLDAKTGERIATHRDRICGGPPLYGDAVLAGGRYAGQFLHLRDGKMEPGFAPLFGVEYRRVSPTVE